MQILAAFFSSFSSNQRIVYSVYAFCMISSQLMTTSNIRSLRNDRIVSGTLY